MAMLGEIRSAIYVEKRQTKTRATLKDLLNKVVSSYNKEVTVRRHRLDTGRKSLLYNLCLVCQYVNVGFVRLRAPESFVAALHSHYDSFRHEVSAMTENTLGMDYWVPGVETRKQHPKYKGKDVFQQILTTSETTACLYLDRVTKETC